VAGDDLAVEGEHGAEEAVGAREVEPDDAVALPVEIDEDGGLAGVLPEHARAHNRSLVLQTLFHQGAMSRADLSRETGLTRVTISDLVAELIDDGYVRLCARACSGSTFAAWRIPRPLRCRSDLDMFVSRPWVAVNRAATAGIRTDFANVTIL
jgi:hypothetical protein